MLLLFVGPLVSQARDMAPGGVPAWMGELACAADQRATGDAPPMPSHEMAWAKCGYCTLLFNSPALGSTALYASLPCDLASPPPSLATQAGHGTRAVFPGALTRAPPVAFA